jgi:predicted GNAT family N-acyltransferase
MDSSQPVCRRAATRDDIAACLDIRDVVFIREQGVDPALERDGLDDESIHYLAEIDGWPVGAARVRVLDDRFKVQRVAVLREARGKGVGEALMRFLMADLAAGKQATGRHFFLSSQSYAVPFYEKLGFSVCSDEYMEAGIAHNDMRAEIGAA